MEESPDGIGSIPLTTPPEGTYDVGSLVVDMQTGLAIEAVTAGGDLLTSAVALVVGDEDLEHQANVERAKSLIAQADPNDIGEFDQGYQQLGSLDDAREAVSYQVPVVTLPDTFELSEVFYGPRATSFGKRGIEVVIQIYRDGLREIVVTSLTGNFHPYGPNDLTDEELERVWYTSPFDYLPRGYPLEESGWSALIRNWYDRPPHFWGASNGAVVTVEGWLVSPAVLEDVRQQVTTHSTAPTASTTTQVPTASTTTQVPTASPTTTYLLLEAEGWRMGYDRHTGDSYSDIPYDSNGWFFRPAGAGTDIFATNLYVHLDDWGMPDFDEKNVERIDLDGRVVTLLHRLPHEDVLSGTHTAYVEFDDGTVLDVQGVATMDRQQFVDAVGQITLAVAAEGEPGVVPPPGFEHVELPPNASSVSGHRESRWTGYGGPDGRVIIEVYPATEADVQEMVFFQHFDGIPGHRGHRRLSTVAGAPVVILGNRGYSGGEREYDREYDSTTWVMGGEDGYVFFITIELPPPTAQQRLRPSLARSTRWTSQRSRQVEHVRTQLTSLQQANGTQ